MLSFIMDLVSTEVNKELLFLAFVFGYTFFFMYFYGSKSWKDFSEIDKVAISLVFGFIAFFFLLYPLYNLLNTLNNIINFASEDMILNNVLDVSSFRFGFFILLVYLAVSRKNTGTALIESKMFHIKSRNNVIGLLLLIIASVVFFGILSLTAIHYSVYFNNIFQRCVLCLILVSIFLIIYDMAFLEEKDTIRLPFKIKMLEKSPLMKLALFGFVFVLLISITTISLIPSIEKSDWKTEVVLEELPVEYKLSFITADKYIYEYYTIAPPLALDWVRIDTDYTVARASENVPNRAMLNYYTNDNYFIVNESNETDVFVKMKEKVHLEDFVSLDADIPEYTNETCHAKIHLKNNFSGTLKIDYLSFYLDSGYEPVDVTANYNRSKSQDSYLWTENNTGSDIIKVKGNTVIIYCFDLYENDSLDVSAVFELKE
jgi:hypothetical protein